MALPSVLPEAKMNLLLLCIVLSWLLVLGLLFSDCIKSAAGTIKQTGMQGGNVDDSRLIQRLRNHKLLMTYLFWKAARYADKPPRLSDVRWQGQSDCPNAFTVAVETPEQKTPCFRYLRVGSALEEQLGRRLGGLRTSEVNRQKDNEYIGSLEGAYRKCVRTLMPSYEYAHYDFGDGSPITFERLILPLVGLNGHVTHLIGIVLFSEQGRYPDGTERS